MFKHLFTLTFLFLAVQTQCFSAEPNNSKQNAKPLIGVTLPPSVSTQSTTSSDVLSRIRKSGVINLAAYPSSVPFNFLNNKSEQAGYAWEISLKLAERIKTELQMPNLVVKKVDVNFKTRFAAITDQLVDIECASTSNTLERQKTVSFSISNFVVGARLLVKRDAGIANWEDLKNKSVAVAAGTSNEKMIAELSEKNGWNIKVLPVKDNNEAFKFLEEGKAQAALGHEIGLYSIISKSSSPVSWTVVAESRSLEAHGCMLPKGDASFKALVDDEIKLLMRNGEIEKLYLKYFLRKLPLDNPYTLGVPPSQEMYKLFKYPNDLPP